MTIDYITDTARDPAVTNLTTLSSYEQESASSNSTCDNITLEPNVMLLVFYTIFFILGVFGNGILVLLFLMQKDLRNINNALITNLAFSDILFVILYAPIKVYEQFYTLRPLGKTFCHISVIINYTSQDVSTMSMMALSYLRYRAVARPLDTIGQDDQQLKCLILVYCGISYVVGILASLFPALHCKDLTDICWPFDMHYVDSYRYPKRHLGFHVVRCVFFFLLPLFVITFFYSMITVKLCKEPAPLERDMSIPARKAIRARKKLVWIVLAIVVIFFLSWLPNYLSWFIGLEDGFIGWLVDTRSVCMFLPSSLNPILLFVTSSSYRKCFLKVFSL
ncbi:Bombesin receptor subtype-3 [Holothuria leucospilota]|uniref:Bombesin receptor subtype-3 n=1 Tax=Holothuria leucospilota TaxID=206669 RepID=A0A9Q1CG69_HOLLE|nr:Bombesin receptor subtype-3 [Holothuria leucospilota]